MAATRTGGHNVNVAWVETSGERRIASEDYPLPVSATFSGTVNADDVSGDAAHDAADIGNPVKVGFKAESTTPAAVADNDRSNWSGTLYGAGFVNLRRASDGAEVGISSFPLVVAVESGSTAISGIVDEVAPGTVGEGSFGQLRITPTRDLRVCLTDSAGANMGTSGNPAYIAGTVSNQGLVNHDSPYNGGVLTSIPPNIIGGIAQSVEPTAVSAGDALLFYVDPKGYQHVKTHSAVQSRSDTFTTTGAGTTVDCSSSPKKFFTIQATATGAVTSWSIVLEGSLDNVTFTTLLTHTNVDPGSGGAKFSTAGTPFLYFRSNCTAFVLGGGTNVIVTILGES